MRKILVTVAAALCLSQAAFAEESSTKVATPDTAVPSSDTPAPTTPAPTPAAKAEVTTPAPAPETKTDKAEVAPKADVHEATWKNGHGSSWKIGPHKYGFEGFFGGCHYTGHAGPHGYHLDKVC
jgi:hypothetical protein